MELVYASNKVKTQCTSLKAARKPLDANKAPFSPCYIDQIAEYVRIVEITEVSKHYE